MYLAGPPCVTVNDAWGYRSARDGVTDLRRRRVAAPALIRQPHSHLSSSRYVEGGERPSSWDVRGMGDEEGRSSGRVWAHCAVAHSKSSQSLVNPQNGCVEGVWHKSREAPRSRWHEKLRPGTQKPSRSNPATTIIWPRRYHHRPDTDAPLNRTIMDS